MSKSAILKSGWVVVNPSETRVIDTNAIAESRIKEMTVKLAEQSGELCEDIDGFIPGLNAIDVTQLMNDDQTYTPEENNVSDMEQLQLQNVVSTSEKLIAEAQAEIEKMKSEALAEIEQARLLAVDEGKKAGYEDGLELGKKEGYDIGHQQGLDSVAVQREKVMHEAEQKINEIEKEYSKKISELEPRFIETLTGIYEHIFNVSLKNFRGLIVHLVQNTMKNIEGNNSYLIHVSRDDYPLASMQKKELLKGTSISVETVEIIEDVTLSRNECMIETGNGVFDCSLGTQLEALREELKLLSYEPD